MSKMLFSYYFDTKKTHLLNCDFKMIEIAEASEGMTKITYEASIEEKVNSISKKREKLTGIFNIPPAKEGSPLHDVEFDRIRHSGSKKWIFTITNAKNTSQTALVGLISTTINKNPLGFDVYNDNGELDTELSENNLATLDPSYIPPVLTQTVVDAEFKQEDLPIRFTSFTAKFDETDLTTITKEFRQDFREEIPPEVPFKMEMHIAPLSIDSIDTERVFDFIAPNLGRVSLLKNGLEYLIHNGLNSDTVRIFFDAPVKLSDFLLDGTLTIKSHFLIEGDGEGNLTIKYYNQTITSIYDHLKPLSYVHFRGSHIGVNI